MGFKFRNITVSFLLSALPATASFAANFGQNQHQHHLPSARVYAFALAAGHCVEIGDRCDASSDCCGGICSFQTCADSGSSSGSCSYGGQSCGSDGECCSGYCASNGACE